MKWSDSEYILMGELIAFPNVRLIREIKMISRL